MALKKYIEYENYYFNQFVSLTVAALIHYPFFLLKYSIPFFPFLLLKVWYDYETHSLSNSGHIEVSTPLEKIPVFLRAGTIIPRRDRVRRASSLMSHDPYTLIIALNNKVSSSSYWHESISF